MFVFCAFFSETESMQRWWNQGHAFLFALFIFLLEKLFGSLEIIRLWRAWVQPLWGYSGIYNISLGLNWFFHHAVWVSLLSVRPWLNFIYCSCGFECCKEAPLSVLHINNNCSSILKYMWRNQGDIRMLCLIGPEGQVRRRAEGWKKKKDLMTKQLHW